MVAMCMVVLVGSVVVIVVMVVAVVPAIVVVMVAGIVVVIVVVVHLVIVIQQRGRVDDRGLLRALGRCRDLHHAGCVLQLVQQGLGLCALLVVGRLGLEADQAVQGRAKADRQRLALLADVQRAQAVLVHMALLVSMMVVMVVVVPGRMVRTGRGCRRQQGASHGQPQRVASGNSRSSGLAGPKGKGMFRSMFHQDLLMGNLRR